MTNDLSSASFHEASYDVIILEKLINALLTTDDLFNSATLYATVINKSIRDHEISLRMRFYLVMKDSLTNYMIKKACNIRNYLRRIASNVPKYRGKICGFIIDRNS